MIMAMSINSANIILAAILVLVSISMSTMATSGSINILNLGALPDGKTDSSLPFEAAWDLACSSSQPTTIYVPPGRFFLRSAYFRGQNCHNTTIDFRIDGTLVAPSNYRNFSSNSWIMFNRVIGVSISGGTLDAQGAALWACKQSSSTSCPFGATTLGFFNSRNIVVAGLTSINSKMFHMVIKGCQNMKLQGINITAPASSPNTDGIHIEHSSGVTVLNSHIATGDDCISIGPGSSDLWIESISCGPGHGISIGSLGWNAQEPGVHNLTVKSVVFQGSDNGVRIKTWARESNGFVRGVVFQHLTMVNVRNPVIIDQHYCPGRSDRCPHKESGVRISDVRYTDIHGTSATDVGVKLDCSKDHPCTGIKLEDVNLSYNNGPAQAACVNALSGAADHTTSTSTSTSTSSSCLL